MLADSSDGNISPESTIGGGLGEGMETPSGQSSTETSVGNEGAERTTVTQTKTEKVLEKRMGQVFVQPSRLKPPTLKSTAQLVSEIGKHRPATEVTEKRAAENVELSHETLLKQGLDSRNIIYDHQTELMKRIELDNISMPFLIQGNIGIKMTEEKNPFEDAIAKDKGLWVIYVRPSLLQQEALNPIILDELQRAVNEKILP